MHNYGANHPRFVLELEKKRNPRPQKYLNFEDESEDSARSQLQPPSKYVCSIGMLMQNK